MLEPLHEEYGLPIIYTDISSRAVWLFRNEMVPAFVTKEPQYSVKLYIYYQGQQLNLVLKLFFFSLHFEIQKLLQESSVLRKRRSLSSGCHCVISVWKESFLQAAEQFLLLLAHFKTETQLILAPFLLSARHSPPLGHHHFHGEAHPQPCSLTSDRRGLKKKLQNSFLWWERSFLRTGYGLCTLKKSVHQSCMTSSIIHLTFLAYSIRNCLHYSISGKVFKSDSGTDHLRYHWKKKKKMNVFNFTGCIWVWTFCV